MQRVMRMLGWIAIVFGLSGPRNGQDSSTSGASPRRVLRSLQRHEGLPCLRAMGGHALQLPALGRSRGR